MVSALDRGNGINYATVASYGPDGGLTSFISGAGGSFAGITNKFFYTPRLQPCRMIAATGGTPPASCTDTSTGNVLDLGYDFHAGSGDNGNVWGITNYKDTTRNQTFAYDALNRLSSAQNAGTDCTKGTANGKTEYWGNSYGYDAWGNLLAKTITKCGAESLSVTADVQNRTHVTAGADYQYDAAGNMTYDARGFYYTYDPENRISGAGGYTYTYDDDGNRVEKSNGSTGTLYWYMSPGIVAESDLAGNLQSEYVFFDGERVARKDLPGGAVSYYFSDHLKTASVITDAAGNSKAESDYYPWGGELQFLANDSNHYKFTGKERDSESGLDLMGARYFSNGLGRFVQPDPIYIADHRLLDPQLLNLYQYGRNNPLRFTDVTGLDVKLDCEQKSQCGDTVKELNSRKDAQFKISQNEKTGLLQVDGKVDASKLSDKEHALYSAITDTDHHATLSVVGESDTVQFGRFDGNGHNTLDHSDLSQLNNVSSQAAGEVIAHEAVEAYGSSFGNGMNYDAWHSFASQFFPEATHDFSGECRVCSPPFTLRDWTFGGKDGVTVQVKTILRTPVPDANRRYDPGKIVEVKRTQPQ